MNTNRFSRIAFGGGEQGEIAANAALRAHEALLVPGTVVRVYRGRPAGLTGPIGDRVPGGYELRGEGLTYIVESRNLEIVVAS